MLIIITIKYYFPTKIVDNLEMSIKNYCFLTKNC